MARRDGGGALSLAIVRVTVSRGIVKCNSRALLVRTVLRPGVHHAWGSDSIARNRIHNGENGWPMPDASVTSARMGDALIKASSSRRGLLPDPSRKETRHKDAKRCSIPPSFFSIGNWGVPSRCSHRQPEWQYGREPKRISAGVLPYGALLGH
jgi:hypothetical protein